MNMPRPEHPMPQWERANWLNLNGTWEFEFDFGVSAIERELWKKEKFDKEIIVPFCPESKLSGIGDTVCRPTGTSLLYDAIPTAKDITWIQNMPHGAYYDYCLRYTYTDN